MYPIESIFASVFERRYLNIGFMTQKFNDGRWSRRIDVADFVYNNITPYEGDASFLAGATERTKKLWNKCLEALAEERANGGVR